MATYVYPQVLVFQDFDLVPVAPANPLRAHVIGPHAYLLRHSDADERPLGLLGYYDSAVDTPYAWPQRPAGAVVDASYVKLFIEDALLPYFDDAVGSGYVITKTSSYNNRIRNATGAFRTNGDYERMSELLDRDVALGDIARVRAVDSNSDVQTLWTYVRDIIGDTVAAEVDAATADDANPATQVASSSVEQIAGAENCVTLTPDHSGYDGLPSGYVNETYDIIVTQGSIGGDFTTAVLRVVSGSGTDDVAELVPEAAGDPTDIGTRGLQVTFDEIDTLACSESADDDGVSADDLIAGQRWRVTVADAFTKPVATSGGTYAGETDTTYVITVTRGGLYADTVKPQISVTTVHGTDVSGPTTVSAAATDVDVGTEGVTVAFSGSGLRKGDKYYIEVTSAAEGPMRTIVLGHNLHEEIAAGTQVELTLYIKKDIEVEQNRIGFAPQLNWETSDTEITVNSGIIAYDSTWTDGGVMQPLDVQADEDNDYGRVYVEYRAWQSTLCNEVNLINDVAELDDAISGPLTPDNPLKWGVSKALANSNGAEVAYTSVCDPDDDDSWADVLSLTVGRDDVYGLVPLTRRRTVLDLFAAHVASQSSPEQGLWRCAWFSLASIPEIPIVAAGSEVPNHLDATTEDGLVCLTVVEDDPLTSGTQYTQVRCTSDNGNFVTNGVRAGDVCRLLYADDGFGNEVYQEFVIDEVQSEDQLRLVTGPSAAISVAARTEVWRTLSATEEAAELARHAGSFGDRRIRAVWPDTIESSGTAQEGYHLCAALAGLVSGVNPHQGLTNVEIAGFSNANRTTRRFGRAQLDTMSGGGVWVVTQEPVTGQIYTRHAVTTGDYDDLNAREEMVTRNVDSISYRFKDALAPYIGVTNVTPRVLDALSVTMTDVIAELQAVATPLLGGQLISATVVELRQHLTLLDRVVVTLSITIPYALNSIELRLVV